MDEALEVQWEEVKVKRRLATVKEWLAAHPNATLWRLAWSIWWRILLMAIGTTIIFGVPILMMWTE